MGLRWRNERLLSRAYRAASKNVERTMTSRSSLPVRTAIDKFAAWRRHRQDLRDLAGLDGRTFFAIARDLCLSSADLELLAKAREGRTANLDRLLDALGIEGAVISRAGPALMRDMERVCALCPQKQDATERPPCSDLPPDVQGILPKQPFHRCALKLLSGGRHVRKEPLGRPEFGCALRA